MAVQSSESDTAERAQRLWRLGGVCCVLLVAAWLRFERLSSYPPGIFHDVAYNGADILDVLSGRLSIFFPANNGREPLFIYLQAATVALFGTNAFGLRIASAGTGVFTVAIVFTWARAWFGYRIGLLTAATLATLLWHVNMSRIGLRVITLPLSTTLTFYLLSRAIERQRIPASALAGLSGGIAAYTYIASRLMPPLALLFVVAELIYDRTFPRRNVRVLIIVTLCWITAFAPLGGYFLAHHEQFAGHTSELSYFRANLDEQRRPLLDTSDRWRHVVAASGRVTDMFLAVGDRNPRHNVPGRPVFDPLVGALFVLGLARCVALTRAPRASRPPGSCHVAIWALLWWLIMIFSTAMFIDAPHFLRTAGGLAPTCLFAGMGLDWMCGLVEQTVRNRWTRYVMPTSVTAVMVWTGLHTYYGIWDVLAMSDDAKIAWETSLRDFAEATAAAVDAQPRSPVYVQIGTNSDFMRLDTQFLASRAAAWRWLAADQTMLPIPADTANGIIVVGDSQLPLVAVAAQAIPGGKIDHTSPGTTQGDVKIPTYQLIRLPGSDLRRAADSSQRMGATFGGQVNLVGAGVGAPSIAADGHNELVVSLVWRFLPAAHDGYDLFVQMLGADGMLLAQEDRGVLSSALAPNEEGLTLHHLKRPVTAPPGPYRIIVGVATPDGSRRLLPTGFALSITANAVVVATVKS